MRFYIDSDNEGRDISGANFSDCHKYRFTLWRRWNFGSDPRTVMFIGLNPSTATHIENDPTVTRCINFAKLWGYDQMAMMNAYAYRSTDPKKLDQVDDPVGFIDNDRALKHMSEGSEMVIAAWGANCSEFRQKEICKLLGRQLYCLGKTKRGFPKHPLYLRADTQPEPFYIPIGEFQCQN